MKLKGFYAGKAVTEKLILKCEVWHSSFACSDTKTKIIHIHTGSSTQPEDRNMTLHILNNVWHSY